MKRTLSFLLVTLSVYAWAQNQTNAGIITDDNVIMTISGEKITTEEFLSVYTKNNKNPDTSPAALDEYMELFVKYKLKVAEAHRLGMDTMPDFKKELEGYRKQLAKPYLRDNEFQEELLKAAYARLQEEIRASHILVKVSKKDAPKDTLVMYKKAKMILSKLKKGEDFEKLAMQYSDDPSVKSNKGDLGFFTGMQMVYAFEVAAYNTKVGDYTIARTRYGYHVIKVTDRRKARGRVKVSHILVKQGDKDSEAVKKERESKAREIHQKLKDGEEFSMLAERFSDDNSSAKNGGELPEFGAGRMVEEFEEVAFSLSEEGEISEPFLTNYGWHIIKLHQKIPVGSFEELEQEITRSIYRDERIEMTEKSFVEKLKQAYNFKSYSKNLYPFQKWITKDLFEATWKKPKVNMSKAVAEWDGITITQDDFANFLEKNQKKSTLRRSKKAFIDYAFKSFIDDSIFKYENSILEDKYPEFKALMREYRDGILLFDLTNKKVWNKAIEDTTGLEVFFANNKEEYKWKERLSGRIFISKDEKVLKKIRKKAKKENDVKVLTDMFNVESQLLVRGKEILVEKGGDAFADMVKWEKGASDIFEKDGEKFFIYIDKILPEQYKKLSETKGSVISAYQNHLEQQWIEELHERFEVKVNKDVLYSVNIK